MTKKITIESLAAMTANGFKEVHQRIGEVDHHLDTRIDRVETKIDRLDTKVDAKFELLGEEMKKGFDGLLGAIAMLDVRPELKALTRRVEALEAVERGRIRQ